MYYARKVDGYFKRKSFFLKFVVFEKKTFRQFHLPRKFETYIEGSALKFERYSNFLLVLQTGLFH